MLCDDLNGKKSIKEGIYIYVNRYRYQFSSVTQSCSTLCDPMNHSTPGLSVHHQLPEFTQTHVHRVSDAIQPSHPLSSPSPPALNLSQHQGLFYFFFYFFLKFYFIFKLYITVLDLPNIKMNPPQVYSDYYYFKLFITLLLNCMSSLHILDQIRSDQSLSHVQLCSTP